MITKYCKTVENLTFNIQNMFNNCCGHSYKWPTSLKRYHEKINKERFYSMRLTDYKIRNMLQEHSRGQYVKKLDLIMSLENKRLCMEEFGTDYLVRR